MDLNAFGQLHVLIYLVFLHQLVYQLMQIVTLICQIVLLKLVVDANLNSVH